MDNFSWNIQLIQGIGSKIHFSILDSDLQEFSKTNDMITNYFGLLIILFNFSESRKNDMLKDNKTNDEKFEVF